MHAGKEKTVGGARVSGRLFPPSLLRRVSRAAARVLPRAFFLFPSINVAIASALQIRGNRGTLIILIVTAETVVDWNLAWKVPDWP